MWEFLMGIVIGDAVSNSPIGRLVRPALAIVFIGLVIAGAIYAGLVLKAVSERSNTPHVHAHSTH